MNTWNTADTMPNDWDVVLVSNGYDLEVGNFNDRRNGRDYAEYTADWSDEDREDFTEEDYDYDRYEVIFAYGRRWRWDKVKYWMAVPELPKED